MPWSSQWSLPFWPPTQHPVNTSPLSYACHMSSPSNLPQFNHPNKINNTSYEVIIMQCFTQSIFLPFRSKYPPQHSVLKKNQSIFLPQSERPSFTQVAKFYILIFRFFNVSREDKRFWAE
jgi:hypothetical protein